MCNVSLSVTNRRKFFMTMYSLSLRVRICCVGIWRELRSNPKFMIFLLFRVCLGEGVMFD